MLATRRDLLWLFFLCLTLSKHFQKRNVSSPAALTTVVPSGLRARLRTRSVWPFSSATFIKLGNFQTVSWFWVKPWPVTISLCSSLHKIEQIWDFASIWWVQTPVVVFQKLTFLSAVPPPVASRLGCQGHQARALTAASCLVRRCRSWLG